MNRGLSRIVLVLLLLMVIAVSALGTITQGFNFSLPPTTTITTITSPSSSTSSSNTTIDETPVSSRSWVSRIRTELSEVIEKLKKLKDEVLPPGVAEVIDEVIRSLEDINSLLESLEVVSPAPSEVRMIVNETLMIINKTLSSLKELLDELRDDIEALREAKIALTKIEAVAGVVADKALEEAKLGNIDKALTLAQKALNLTNGVIDAYYRKAKVFETYAIAFRNICEGLAKLIKALTGLIKALYLYS